MEAYSRRYQEDSPGHEFRPQMLLWANNVVARQSTLHVTGSTVRDSDQLAWAIAIVARFGDDLVANLGSQEILDAALEVFALAYFLRNHAPGWSTFLARLGFLMCLANGSLDGVQFRDRT